MEVLDLEWQLSESSWYHRGTIGSRQHGRCQGTKVNCNTAMRVAAGRRRLQFRGERYMQYTYPGKHILIVEDKRINMEIIKGFWKIQSCIDERNGKEALEKGGSIQGRYIWSGFLVDIRMPVMKGDEATMKIRALIEKTASGCLSLQWLQMPESDVDSYQCGMNGHISDLLDRMRYIGVWINGWWETVKLNSDISRCKLYLRGVDEWNTES